MYALRHIRSLPAVVLLTTLALAAAPARAQTLYVSSGGGLQTFNTTTGAATPFNPTFISGNVDHATQTAFDSVGNLIVVNAFGGVGNAGTLEKITPGGIGTQINTFLSSGDLNDPYGLVLDSAGNIYLGNKGDSLIEKITPTGVGTIFAGPAQGVNVPRGLAFDSTGNLYVANFGSSTIEKFNTVTGASTLFADSTQGLNAPIGLAFDKMGNLYAANFSGASITEFNTATGVGTLFSKSFTSGSIRSPYGLAFDEAGNLYTANATPGTIERFDTNGNGTLFASGLTSPNYLTFRAAPITATPEPSTWAAFGFTGVFAAGLMLRARRGRRRSSGSSQR